MATAAGIVPLEAAAPDRPEQGQRIATLDFIRGIAVLGILATNIINYSQLAGAHRWVALIGYPSVPDQVLWLFNLLFVDGKLRGLFALLFGVGLVVFMDRARAKGVPARLLQFRRLFWLALFGLAHFFLFFEGDILFDYAIWGMAALWLVRLPARWLLGLGMLVYCLDTPFSSLELGGWAREEHAMLALPPGNPERAAYFAQDAADKAEAVAEGAMLAHGGFAEIVAYRLSHYLLEPLYGLQYAFFDGFACMLIGAALYRMGFFSGDWDRAGLLKWGKLGIAASALMTLPLGLWLIAAQFPRALNMFVFYGPSHVVRLPMILGYAAVLVAMTPQWAPGALGRRLSAAGRMAFTNYLGSSIVMAFVFQGWGLGLFGQFHRVGMVPFVLLGWTLMLAGSPWWLARFRYGPLEWLWRCLTYGRLFPNRR